MEKRFSREINIANQWDVSVSVKEHKALSELSSANVVNSLVICKKKYSYQINGLENVLFALILATFLNRRRLM